jgi:hypothetical protein
MDICLLSLAEVQVLEVNGQLPCCQNHRHISVSDAVEGVKIDIYRSVGEEYNLWCVCEQSSNSRVWRPTLSGGIEVSQLVSPNKSPRIPDPIDPNELAKSHKNHKAYQKYHERRTDHLQGITAAKLVDVVSVLYEPITRT